VVVNDHRSRSRCRCVGHFLGEEAVSPLDERDAAARLDAGRANRLHRWLEGGDIDDPASIDACGDRRSGSVRVRNILQSLRYRLRRGCPKQVRENPRVTDCATVIARSAVPGLPMVCDSGPRCRRRRQPPRPPRWPRSPQLSRDPPPVERSRAPEAQVDDVHAIGNRRIDRGDNRAGGRRVVDAGGAEHLVAARNAPGAVPAIVARAP